MHTRMQPSTFPFRSRYTSIRSALFLKNSSIQYSIHLQIKLNSWMVRKFCRTLRLSDQFWPHWFVGLARWFHLFPDHTHEVTMQKYAPVYRSLMAKSCSKRMKRFKGGVWLGDCLLLPFGQWINPWTKREVYVGFLSFEDLVSLELLRIVEPTGSQANRALKMLDSAWLLACSRRNKHPQKPFSPTSTKKHKEMRTTWPRERMPWWKSWRSTRPRWVFQVF